MDRNELLERLLELKGKVPLTAEDWEVLNTALKDPSLKQDREMLELLDMLEDETRIQAQEDEAFLKFKSKMDIHDGKIKAAKVAKEQKPKSSWWETLTKPRRPWGLPLVLAQLLLFSVYFDFTSNQDSTDIIIEHYRSERTFDTCEVVKVRFNPEITIQDISDVLRKANLKILSGPASANEYVISRGSFNEEQLQGFFEKIGEVDLSNCRRLGVK
jgi:hypothetical protein